MGTGSYGSVEEVRRIMLGRVLGTGSYGSVEEVRRIVG